VIRRARAVLVVGALLSISLTAIPAAQADNVSVTGTGSFRGLSINNGGGPLVIKVQAPGGPCTVKYISVPLNDRDGTAYRLAAGCYPGSVWAASLEQGQALVPCPGLSMTWGASARTWTARIPRSCLRGLAGTLRAGRSYVDDFSPAPGAAGPTPYVRQSCGSTQPSC
jgi:hypothetical protein